VTLDLNVFTNFCANSVEQLPIFGTLRSFSNAFQFDAFSNIRVFCHAAPLSVPFPAFYAALQRTVPGRAIELYSTRGLVDGYVQSLNLSKAEMLFQLEHDYAFDATRLHHGTTEIANAMRAAGVPYLRFNIVPNENNELDTVTQIDMAGIPCCQTVIFSNRPHFLDRTYALTHYVPKMNVAGRGYRGIEKELTAALHTGWIYGPKGHPPIIRHIDGHTALRQWRKQSLSRRILEFASRNTKMAREHFGLGRYGRIY
jgi:hypothetical protein